MRVARVVQRGDRTVHPLQELRHFATLAAPCLGLCAQAGDTACLHLRLGSQTRAAAVGGTDCALMDGTIRRLIALEMPWKELQAWYNKPQSDLVVFER